MAKRYLTVVFAIEDEHDFKPMQEQLHSRMMAEDTIGWRVSAMALGDEMTRIELLESGVREVVDIHELRSIVDNIASTPLQNLEGKTLADFTS